jgi:hypothetical protein
MSTKSNMPTIKTTRTEQSGVYKNGVFYSTAEILQNKKEQSNFGSSYGSIGSSQQPNYVRYVVHGSNSQQYIPYGSPFW